MIGNLIEILKDKKVLILGFGKEGISSYRFLIKYLPAQQISIADQDERLLEKSDQQIDKRCKLYLGSSYLDSLDRFDLVIKSPGISKRILKDRVKENKITSQTGLFLKLFSDRIIGVTGTKGKSTTASLINHILSAHSSRVVFVGNIGIPPFDLIENISSETRIVFELSSHQLQDVSWSPHVGILLNLFEEHLDHYADLNEYHLAKVNIAKYQKANDWLIVNDDDPIIKVIISKYIPVSRLLSYSVKNKISNGAFTENPGKIKFRYHGTESAFDISERISLAGDHNLGNIMAAICAVKILKIPDEIISGAINSFTGLSHRMEYLGKFKGIHFYNDSIATIPEATISAIKTLKKVDTLILGGKDRGIDYSELIDFLPASGVSNLIFTGEAGNRIMNELKSSGILKDQKLFFIPDYNELPEIIRKNTLPGHICLLSPAASSYDMFKNFEERGDVFKKIAEKL